MRGKVLNEALNKINGERQDQYGNPEDSFHTIASYWSIYLEVPVNGNDVALMMTLFKIAREAHQHKADNLIDAAGYLGISGDMHESPVDGSQKPAKSKDWESAVEKKRKEAMSVDEKKIQELLKE